MRDISTPQGKVSSSLTSVLPQKAKTVWHRIAKIAWQSRARIACHEIACHILVISETAKKHNVIMKFSWQNNCKWWLLQWRFAKQHLALPTPLNLLPACCWYKTETFHVIATYLDWRNPRGFVRKCFSKLMQCVPWVKHIRASDCLPTTGQANNPRMLLQKWIGISILLTDR